MSGIPFKADTLLSGLATESEAGLFGPLDVTAVRNNIRSIGPIYFAEEYGAIGSVLTTTGSMTSGQYTVTVDDATGWKVGSGIGVAGAGASSGVLQSYVTAINGTVLTLHDVASGTVSGAAVTSDDGVPIQERLDYCDANGGGVVQLGPKTYVIGVPNAQHNAPLFVGSNTTLRGMGKHHTVLKVCDNAKQLPWAWMTKRPSSLDLATLKRYPQASVIVNRRNTQWHHNEDWDNSFPLPDNYLPADVNIVIEDMTIDGNSANQPYITSGGNQTKGTIPDPIYTFTVASANTGGGSLTVGHEYDVAVTYNDGTLPRKETCSNPYQVRTTISGGHNSLVVSMSTPPPNATKMRIWLRDVTSDPLDTTTYPDYPNSSDWLDQAWEIVGEYTAGTSHTILSHTPGSSYPPGIGTFTAQGQDSSITYNIFLDNLHGVRVARVDLTGICRDGLVLSTLDTDYRQDIYGAIEHPVTNGHFVDMDIDNAPRCGFSITGKVNSILFERINCEYCACGCDVEADSYPFPQSNVVFSKCRFAYSFRGGKNLAGIGGLFLYPAEESPNRGLVVEGCTFEWNQVHLGLAKNDGTTIVHGNTFSNAFRTAITSSQLGATIIRSNTFVENGKSPGSLPTLYNFAAEAGDIIISDSLIPDQCCVIDGNVFWGNPSNPAYHQAIQLTGSTRGAVISNNIFGLIKTPYDLSRETPDTCCRILVYGRMNDHTFYGNQGRYLIQDFRDNAVKDVRLDSFYGRIVPKQLARHDFCGLECAVDDAATYLDVTFMPDVIQSHTPGTGPLAQAGYRVDVSPGWNCGGWWISNKTQSGFRINWATAPTDAGASSVTLDWSAEYLSPQIVSVGVSPSSATISHSSTQQFTATATYSDGTTQDITAQIARWRIDPASTDPDAATIDAAGLLHGVSAGSVNVLLDLPAYTKLQDSVAGSPSPDLPISIAVTLT